MPVARATEHAKAEGLVKIAEKRACKKAAEDDRAEEARVPQEERVKVKEAAKEAAVAARDGVVEAVKGCTEGPALVEAAERVVNVARLWRYLRRRLRTVQLQWRLGAGKSRWARRGRPFE